MTFKPFPGSDRWRGLVALLMLLVMDLLLARWAIIRPIDGFTFILGLFVLVSILALGYIGFRTVGTFTLQYSIDRDAVTLVWGPTRQIVPLGTVRRIVRNPASRPHGTAQPWHWPCPHRRRYFCEGLGFVNAYATRSLTEQIILETDEESYGISPQDPDGFIQALQERYALGVVRPLRAELQRPPLWTWRLWRDRNALFLIGAGLVSAVLMFGIFCFRLPDLSSDLPFHFDVNGLPDRIGPKTGLVALPAIALLAWVVNLVAGVLVYRRVQQHGAYLLWGGALAVQMIAALALFNIMRW
jgi:hypothetical protein